GLVVQDTQPTASGTGGRAFEIEDYEPKNARATVSLTGSVVRRNLDLAVSVAGSDVTVEACTVRDTQPRVANGKFGRGIGIQDHIGRGVLSVRDTLVERSHDVGLFVGGSDATIEGVLVRDTAAQASDMTGGRGMNFQYGN